MSIYLSDDVDLPVWWCRFICLMSICLSDVDLSVWWCRFICLMESIYLSDYVDLSVWLCWFICLMMLIYMSDDVDLSVWWCWFICLMMITGYSSEHVNYSSNYTNCGQFVYWLLKNEPSSMDFVITFTTTLFLCIYFICKSTILLWYLILFLKRYTSKF
jgi:hypothetical protein